ncbi:MAG TPA: phosphatase PAP2 family protein [Rectinemataceae bacterium]|nr:phosphatase PAP2 family protein [Rectinemataceae bacterium]
MNSVLSWGLDLVRKVQEFFGPGMLAPMQVITFFGSEFFALAALPLIYWCVDRRKGARIGIVVLFSAFLNLWCKIIFKQPRPYDFDSSVGLIRENTFGLPSGHAQMSITFWGVMLTILSRALGVVLLIAMPLIVGLSRLYLGVHFPTDLLGGWILGGIVLGLFYGFGARIEGILSRLNLRQRLIAVSAVSLLMNLLMPSDTLLSGAFFGSAAGFALASKNLRFNAGGELSKRIIRYVAGIVGLVILYTGPKLMVGESLGSQQPLIRFLRYGIIGFWVAYGAPWCFWKMKLLALDPAA